MAVLAHRSRAQPTPCVPQWPPSIKELEATMPDEPAAPGMIFQRLAIAGLHGLDTEQVHRLCALVVMHLNLDGLLSLRLYMFLKNAPHGPAPDEKEFGEIARHRFSRRLRLIETAGLLPAKHVRAIRALNKARNTLLHATAGQRLGQHPALASHSAFSALYDPAARALTELVRPTV
jgi:hypothetical protein